jgi:hypothetical protein
MPLLGIFRSRSSCTPPSLAVKPSGCDGSPACAGTRLACGFHPQAPLSLFFYPYMRTIGFTSPALPQIAVLPRAPVTGSPVPSLTSLFHWSDPGPWGDRGYPGNCSGKLIKDLLLYFRPKSVFDPMTGSGTCRDVCDELDIPCTSKDIRFGFDACDETNFAGIGPFDFIWIHPPYFRQKIYSKDSRDMSNAPNLSYFLYRYDKLIRNCASVLAPGGKLAILMGDYSDRDAGFVPLTYHTKRLCFQARLRQPCTDIIRFSHGASSSTKVYRSSFIPGLHDTCMVFEKQS